MKNVKVFLRREYDSPVAGCLISRFYTNFTYGVVDESYVHQPDDIILERAIDEDEKTLFVLLEPASYPLPWCPDCPRMIECVASYRFDLADGELYTEDEFREMYPENWNTDYCYEINLD